MALNISGVMNKFLKQDFEHHWTAAWCLGPVSHHPTQFKWATEFFRDFVMVESPS